MVSRFARSLVSTAGALLLTLLLTLLLNLAPASPAAALPQVAALSQASPPLPPASAAGPALVAADTFSPTVLVTVSAAAPAFGDEITVAAELITSGICSFTLQSNYLAQSEPSVDPLFTYLDPPSGVIQPPGANPASWRLMAARAGATVLTASFSGMLVCDGVMDWKTVNSEPQPVTIAAPPALAALPFVGRNTPPIPITDLGALGEWSYATAINNRGEVVGVSRTTAEQDHAFLWREGIMIDLGVLRDGDSATSYAAAINDRGQVVGGSTSGPPPVSRGFLWQSGVMTDLGSLDGRSSFAVGVNARGQVIGRSSAISGGMFSFLWANGVMTNLGTLGGVNTEAVDLNNRGQVVGTTTTKDGVERAFLWRDGVLINLHPKDDALFSKAIGINERGQAAGDYSADGRTLGFLWEEWVITPIAGPGGASVSTIDDFNERGQVVGTYFSPSGRRHFLWERDAAGAETALDLGPVSLYPISSCPSLIDDNGWVVLQSPTGPVLWRDGKLTTLASLTPPRLYSIDCPRAMNNRGQIVGMSIDATGVKRAVLWDAGE